MDLKVAEILVDYSSDLELHEDYSGRGMFGSKTTGVTGSMSDLINSLKVACLEGTDEEKEIMSSFDFRDLRSDSMGYDTIFY